jgi:hypothetical protein
LPKQKSGLCSRLYYPETSNKACVHGSGRIEQHRFDQKTRLSMCAALRMSTSETDDTDPKGAIACVVKDWATYGY